MTDEPPEMLLLALRPFYRGPATPPALLRRRAAMVRTGPREDIATIEAYIDPGVAGVGVLQAEPRCFSPNTAIGLSRRKIAHCDVLGSAAACCEPETTSTIRSFDGLFDDGERCQEMRGKCAELSNCLISKKSFESMVADVYLQLCASHPKSAPAVQR